MNQISYYLDRTFFLLPFVLLRYSSTLTALSVATRSATVLERVFRLFNIQVNFQSCSGLTHVPQLAGCYLDSGAVHLTGEKSVRQESKPLKIGPKVNFLTLCGL